MTLVEFLAPLLKNPHKDKILAILYYNQRYKNIDSLTIEQIRAQLVNARVPKHSKINIADVLIKAGACVDALPVLNGKRPWKLTVTGDSYVRSLLNLSSAEPEIEHDVASLSDLSAKIKDPVVKDFISEAIKCLQISALRAGIVFLWSGVIRTIQQACLDKGHQKLNAALLKHDQKSRQVSTIEDFANVKDKITLLAARELGIFDKGEWQTLQESLDLRNRCGHPTKYKPGVKKASSFIEDVVGITW